MKTNQIFIFGSIIVLAASQSLDSLPECGKTCVNNMFAKARELGCADGDTACLCKNINFAYGIRDCSSALCGALAAAPVITYGSNYCNSVGSGNGTDVSGGNGSLPLSPPAIPGPAPASATNSPDGNRTPISTAPLVSTITTGNEPITTTLGFSTVYSSNEGTKPTDSSSTATTSSTSDSSQSSSQTEGESSTSAGSGARQTACAGLAAAAGLAAMLL